MRLDKLVSARPRTLSIEFSPPRTPTGWTVMKSAIRQLADLGPDFMTVTYGAGGTTRDGTREAVGIIHEGANVPAMAHLTCVGSTRDDLRHLLDEYATAGIANLLALRGDPPAGAGPFRPLPGGFAHARDLIEFLVADGRFAVGCAAFPERHPEAQTREADWDNLIAKFRAGACLALTQMFFDAADYVALTRYLAARARPGETFRVVPGIFCLHGSTCRTSRRTPMRCSRIASPAARTTMPPGAYPPA